MLCHPGHPFRWCHGSQRTWGGQYGRAAQAPPQNPPGPQWVASRVDFAGAAAGYSASLSLSRLRPTGIPGRRSRIPRFRQPRRRRGTLEPARAVGLIDLIDQAVPKHHPGPACRVAPTLAERSRPDSSVRIAGAAAVGVDVHRKTICVPVSLSATNISSTSLTRMRIPRVRGRPPPCLGLRVIRSAYFMAVPHGSAGAP